MKKIINIIFYVFFTNCVAQKTISELNFFKNSPESNFLFRKVDIPLNYAYGGVNYSLPIYTIKLKNIEIPISLNYRSSGFIVSENASDVGLGWHLDVGGLVTHMPRGGSHPENRPSFYKDTIVDPLCNQSIYNPDILSRCESSDYNWIMDTNFGLLDNRSKNYTTRRKDEFSIYTYFDPPNPITHDIKAQQDIFYYSFPNESGKFFYDDRLQKFVSIPYNRNEYMYDGKVIIITDTKGNKYKYSIRGSQRAITKISSYYPNSRTPDIIFQNKYYNDAPNSFLLSEIETVDGETVVFLYSPIKYGVDGVDVIKYVTKVNSSLKPLSVNEANEYEKFKDSYIEVFNIFDTYRIDKIIVNGRERVKFQYSKNSRLDVNHENLNIYDNNNKIVESVEEHKKPRAMEKIIIHNSDKDTIVCSLDYDYFGKHRNIDQINNLSTYKNYRLKLNSVSINNEEKYKFSYFENEDIKLPNKNSIDRKDYLGYFNNKVFNYSPFNSYDDIKAITNNTDNIYKKPDLDYAKLTVLNSIEYPTGGKSTFEYSLGGKYGGLKIDEIKTYENGEINYYKKLKYKKSHYTVEPVFDNFFYINEYLREYNLGIPLNLKDLVKSQTIIERTSSSINELLAFNGYPNFYENVEEYIYDKDNSIKEMINYNFTYDEDIFFSSYGNYHYSIPMVSNNWKRGYLKSQLFFRGSDLKNPIRKIENIYTFDDIGLDYNSVTFKSPLPRRKKHQGYFVNYYVDILVPEITWTNMIPYTISKPTPYQPEALINVHFNFLVSASVYKEKEIITDFLGNKELTTTTEYIYDKEGSNLVKSKKVTFPDKNITEYIYSYAENLNRKDLINRNIIEVPLITEEKKNGITIHKEEINYGAVNINEKKIILPKYQYKFDIQNNINPTSVTTYTKYDDRGNLLEYKIDDILPVAIVYGYNQSLPIAKIEGATYAQIQSIASDIIQKSNIGTEQELLESLNRFRTDNRLNNFQITTYTHRPLIGVSSITPPTGITEFYRYDSANRLEKVIDANNKVIKTYKYHYKN